MISFVGFRNMLDRLDQVRKSMDGAKNTKLLFRWERRGDYDKVPFQDIVDAIYEEFEELSEAMDVGTTGIYYSQARANIRDEVVDVVNMLEMLWDVLDLGGAG